MGPKNVAATSREDGPARRAFASDRAGLERGSERARRCRDAGIARAGGDREREVPEAGGWTVLKAASAAAGRSHRARESGSRRRTRPDADDDEAAGRTPAMARMLWRTTTTTTWRWHAEMNTESRRSARSCINVTALSAGREPRPATTRRSSATRQERSHSDDDHRGSPGRASPGEGRATRDPDGERPCSSEGRHSGRTRVLPRHR